MCNHILIVEDDLTIADMVSMNLGVAGYTCTCAYTSPEALALVAKESYDIALLDVMLPGMDGFSLMPSLKDKGIPVIYVTAKNALEDKVRGLRMGAEDYLVKPFEMLELIVRIEKVLARNKPKTSNLTFLNVAMDMENRVVFLDSAEVVLTPIEYGLLRELLLHPRMTHTRERLLNLVWGDSFFGETRTVDVHIAYLRKKLGWGKVIVTVHKVGYRLEPNAFMGG